MKKNMAKRISTIILLIIILAGIALPVFAIEPDALADITIEENISEQAALPQNELAPADNIGTEIIESDAVDADLIDIIASPVILPTDEQINKTLEESANYLLRTVASPGFSVAHGEWTMLGLARSGNMTKEFQNKYLSNLFATLDEKQGVLSKNQYTDYSRVVIALSAIDFNPTDVNSYNLLSPLSDFNNVTYQGVNGAAWALIALDSKKYKIPQSNFEDITTRQKLIAHILDRQLADGGWSLLSNAPRGDADITAMALTAIAPYSANNSNVASAIEKALEFLSRTQNKNGGFGFCESVSQVVVALSTLGIPQDDPRFVKNGNTPIGDLLRFYNDDGSFSHSVGSGADPIATDQAMYAITALSRMNSGKTTLFDMTDSTGTPNDNIKEVKLAIDALTPPHCVGKKGDVALLMSRLKALPKFKGKTDYTQKLNNIIAEIEKSETILTQLDKDIWEKLDPKNITLADAQTINELMAVYSSLCEHDKGFLKNADSLLDANTIVDALKQGTIHSKVFQNLKGSDSVYTYSGSGYSLSFSGSDVGTPANMLAGVSTGLSGSLSGLKNAYWVTMEQQGTLPATIKLSTQTTAQNGEYVLYSCVSDRLVKLGNVSVTSGIVEFYTSQGGEFALINTAKPPTFKIDSTGKNKDLVNKNIFEQLKGQNINLIIESQTDTGLNYRLTFNGEDITSARPFNPQINIGGQNTNNIKKLAENPFILSFAHSGKLPGKMLVEIESPLADGEYLLFFYNEEEMRALPEQKVTVKDGWANFFMEHCSDWFIAERAKKNSLVALVAEKTPQSATKQEQTTEPNKAPYIDRRYASAHITPTEPIEKPNDPLIALIITTSAIIIAAIFIFMIFIKSRKAKK